MNREIQSVMKIINRYAVEYPDLTEKELQEAMAAEIVDILQEEELAIGERVSHNRTNVSIDTINVE